MRTGGTIVVALAGWLAGAPAARADGAALDGKSFSGESGEQGKTASEKDTLVFAGGKFHSTACDEYGFAEAPYRVRGEGSTLRFEADSSSPSEGSIHWSGTVRGDLLDGTFVWAKAGEPVARYWIKAKLSRAK
jgi:hypothetical protein